MAILGMPGVVQSEKMPDEVQAQMLMRSQGQEIIGKEEIQDAIQTLSKYKQGKANLEKRIVNDEEWWKLRHWDVIKGKSNTQPQPSSAWLFNAILNKHADAMDNYPESVVLPRERNDEDSAKTLSSVLPVIMEYNDFEKTYSDNWWEKLKHGTACYGVFWNNDKNNGLGDVDIRSIDLLKVFWEPGITNIQDSKNLFICELVDMDILKEQYPDHADKLKGDAVDIAQYRYDDTVDTSDKAVVVDWYYKRKAPNGRTLLHYVKFVNSELLFASENDPQYRDVGWYEHGLYPVVMDVMFPEKGTPVGFGYVAICKDPQLYIDKLSANILENSMMGTKKRFFKSSGTNINEADFLDWNKPFIEVEGSLDDRGIKELEVRPLDGIYLNVLQLKIEEMKDTAANRDVNSGGTSGGVNAASAIAALQEAGNKASRDMIATSYRNYVEIADMVIELMRQFYDEARSFRITGEMPGEYQFIDVSNAGLKDQFIGTDSKGFDLYRKPIFDLKIKAQKKNPFSRMEQNERAKELYAAGFFNPDRAQESMVALDMMEFEGIDKIKEQVSQGQTLMNICQQLQQQNAQLIALLQGGIPQNLPIESGNALKGTNTQASSKPASNGLASGIMQAHTPMTSYGQRLAERSKVSMND